MNLFSKKETPVQNIAFMGIMAAISIIITVLLAVTDMFFVGLSLFVMLLLPLSSAIVEVCCKDRYYPIYFFATLGLALVATLWNIQSTILYLFPSLITGYLFGLSAKYKVSPIWVIISCAIIQAGITYATIPLINYILGIDIIHTFLVFFSLQDSVNITYIIPSVILLLSLIQITLSYFVINNEIKKFGYEYEEEEVPVRIICYITIGFSLSIIGLYFLSLELAYLAFLIAIYFAIVLLSEVVSKRMWKTLIFSLVSVIVSSLIYVFIYTYLNPASGLLVHAIAPFLIASIILLVSFLKKGTLK